VNLWSKIESGIYLNIRNLSNSSIIKASLSQAAQGPDRDRGGDRPWGRSLSAGLIFPLSCFASGQTLIHQGVQGKFAKKKRTTQKEKKCSR
jgi:hypothetical protein